MAGEQITITVNGEIEYQGDAADPVTLDIEATGNTIIQVDSDPVLSQSAGVIIGEVNQIIKGEIKQ